MNSSTRSKGRQKAGIDAAFNGGGIGAFMDHGETAMWSTIFAGAIGGLAGYVSHREQYPKDIRLDSNKSYETAKRNYWKSQATNPAYRDSKHLLQKGNAPIGSDGYSMVLHHPYGREGNNLYIVRVMTQTQHINFIRRSVTISIIGHGII